MAQKKAASENTIQIHFPAQPDVGIMFAQTVEVPDTGDFVHDKHVAAEQVKGIKKAALNDLHPDAIEKQANRSVEEARAEQEGNAVNVPTDEQIHEAAEAAGKEDAEALADPESEDEE